MMKPIAVAFAVAAIVICSPRPLHAAEPPWCLVSSFGGEHCRYSSLDACLRERSGGSFCNPNPRYRGGR